MVTHSFTNVISCSLVMAFMLISVELPSPGMLDDIWLSSDSFTLMVLGIEFGAVPEYSSRFLVGIVYLLESNLFLCK